MNSLEILLLAALIAQTTILSPLWLVVVRQWKEIARNVPKSDRSVPVSWGDED